MKEMRRIGRMLREGEQTARGRIVERSERRGKG